MSRTAATVRVGEYVELAEFGSGVRLRGLVTDVEVDGSFRYVTLYSYLTREVTRYRIDRRARLHRVERTDAVAAGSDRGSPTYDDAGGDELSSGLIVAPLLVSVFAAILLSLVLLAPAQAALNDLRVGRMSYHTFIEREMGLGQLVSEVSARMDYRVDLEDYWSAPEDAWASRSGDCEDHAMVVSAYLSRHGVAHSVMSFALQDGLQGHVVVIARTGEGLVLLDPTRASAPTGIRRFERDTGMAEVIAEYGVLPATNYGERPKPGNPAPTGRTE